MTIGRLAGGTCKPTAVKPSTWARTRGCARTQTYTSTAVHWAAAACSAREPLLLKPSTRREAQDVTEQLLKAASHTLSRAYRTGGVSFAKAELPSLGPHSDAWGADDVGVLALGVLEEAAVPLMHALYSGPKKAEQERAVDALRSPRRSPRSSRRSTRASPPAPRPPSAPSASPTPRCACSSPPSSFPARRARGDGTSAGSSAPPPSLAASHAARCRCGRGS